MVGFFGANKLAAVAVIAVAGAFAISTEAHASDVHVRLGFNSGPRYYSPPIVVQPRYYTPAPTYYYSQPHCHYQPRYYSQSYGNTHYYNSTPQYYGGRDYRTDRNYNYHNSNHYRGHTHRR